MATEIKMPQLGESVTEGTVGRWLKQPGDPVARYEPLLEVVTDKVDTEVPSPVAGTLLEILVPEGETVHVGTVVARIGAAQVTGAEQVGGGSRAAGAEQARGARPADEMPLVARVVAPAVAGPRNAYLSPVVARLVAEQKLDLTQIVGTGQDGRVTKQDVLRFIEARAAEREAVAALPAPSDLLIAAPVAAELSERPQVQPLPPGPLPAAPQPDELLEEIELVPLSPIRRSIAEHMLRSVRTAPHVTTVMEVDLSRVIADRAANQAAFARQGVRLTFTPYFIQASVAGLQQVPVLNGSFSEQGILLHRRIHVGMAVARDEGLIVPVLRDADGKNLLGLARAVNDMAERARTHRLKPDETQGGTFTVTNHGTSGSLFATPIINQPQAGILGIGAIVKRPVVVSHAGGDAIVIKPICYLSLTFDHRIADGAVGDAFLMAVKRQLEGE